MKGTTTHPSSQSKDSKEKSSGDVVDLASLEQAITERLVARGKYCNIAFYFKNRCSTCSPHDHTLHRVEVERKLSSSVEEVVELRALLDNIDRQHQQVWEHFF